MQDAAHARAAGAKQRQDELFYAALNVADPAERRAYLDRACAGDAALRAAVEEMLAACKDADQFFARTMVTLPLAIAAATKAAQNDAAGLGEGAAEEQVGSRIGRYRLIQKLGEGGCGAVYSAEQVEPFRRDVALKVIKLGMDTRSVIARFDAERQALALMDHANIARVLDAGATENGRPYFVMELVRGVRITEYCNQHNLSTERRLELFIQICHAIQHAHQKGIIHRDIKPSNILVTEEDGVPVPKVIDFGIAKAMQGRLTDHTLFTAYEQFIGTPAYVSPEQAELGGFDIDTRSDIYSLGVLLYELLTGRTPFDGKRLLQSGLDQMRRTLREKDPPRPSTMLTTLQGEDLRTIALQRQAEPPRLISTLRGDLDWIVMKALEKDRTRRYETADSLGQDIEHHLHNEPVSARPPSRLYRFHKLVRRNQVVFALGLAMMAALIGGMVVSTWLLLREREARRQEIRLRREAEERQKMTEAAFLVNHQQLEQADRLLSEISRAQPSLESESVFRALGWWHAIRGDWKQAAERFDMLLRVNRSNTWDTVTGDVMNAGPPLVELGDAQRYERFRQEIIARFAGTTNPVVAERVLKTSLLVPADNATMKALAPLAEVAERSFDGTDPASDDFLQAWRCVSVGLMEYRRGNCRQAANWAARCLACRDYNGPRVAAAHVIMALSRYRLQETNEARTHLAEAEEIINAKFRNRLDYGSTPHGFWHDWVFARILLVEAADLSQARSRTAGYSGRGPEPRRPTDSDTAP